LTQSPKGKEWRRRHTLSDKYAVVPVQVPCPEKLDVCRAACCYEARFALTLQDIVEGTVKFNLEGPYRIAVCDEAHCVRVKQTEVVEGEEVHLEMDLYR